MSKDEALADRSFSRPTDPTDAEWAFWLKDAASILRSNGTTEHADWVESAATRLEALQAQPVGEDLAPRKAVNRILGELLGPLIPDFVERMAVGNRVCSLILAALTASPPVVERERPTLERWGFKWQGHDNGTHVRMGDGYWTPWHIAQGAILALTPVEGVGERITREARLRMFLEIIDADGGHETIDDGSWANAFTEEYEKQSPDTINWAVERGFINVTFNDMFETSTAHLTKAGREYLSTPVAQGDEVRDALEEIARKIDKQADCLDHYAVQSGHPEKPVPSVFHLQSSHFRDLAKEMRATLTKGARDAG